VANEKKPSKKMTIQERLVYIQKELKAPKSQYNAFSKYNYRSCEDILEAVKSLLGECSLTISDEIVQFGNETDVRFYVKATVRLSRGTKMESDVIENTAFAREASAKKGMDEAQITGAASSYARKYALNGLFAIDDTKDADTVDNRNDKSSATPTGTVDKQEKLTKKHNIPDGQVAPKCPNCKAVMKIVERKDGSGVFWSCPNWRKTKECGGVNVEMVNLDGSIQKKKPRGRPKKEVPAEEEQSGEEITDDIPF